MSQKITKIDHNRSYGLKIYQQLKMLIINGDLKAGSTINEREYSAMLGVSRTPLRDALNRLECEGWVEQNGKARTISVLRWRDILNMIELRSTLGHLAMNLAFPKYTEADIEHLNGILLEMSRYSSQCPQDYYTVMRLDTNFHNYITSITGNSMLIKMDSEMNEKFCRSNCLAMRLSKQDGRFHAQQHLPLLDSMRNHDIDAAHQALDVHFKVWEERMSLLPKSMGFDRTDLNAPIQEKFIG